MKVRLVHEFRFEAAHRLPKVPRRAQVRAPARAQLPGRAGRCGARSNEATGWFIDFQRLYDAWAPLHEQLDHNYLNEVPGLENPTSEVLARWVWERIKARLEPLVRVTVFETCDARCEYEGLA